MFYAMLLDDERLPGDERIAPIEEEFVICKNYFQAKEVALREGCPSYIAFDHDLGVGYKQTGFDFAKWLVEKDLDCGGKFIPNDFKFHVHSMNPVGAKNIQQLLRHYLAFRSIRKES